MASALAERPAPELPTAWLVFDDNGWNTEAIHWQTLDRPCDNQFTHDPTWDCPDCDGTGRRP